MSYLNELSSVLKTVRQTDANFLGKSQSVGSGRLYGGLLMAQAIDALYQSVDRAYFLHSYHCYFIRPGLERYPVEYRIINKRDGNFFSNRSLEAYQNEKFIFSVNASFHREEKTFETALEKNISKPENLISWRDLALKYSEQIPKEAHGFFHQKWPFEIYPIDGERMFSLKQEKPIQTFWLKSIDEAFLKKENVAMQQILFAYISDLMLLQTAGMATEFKLWQRKALYSSIDQSIWFHHKFDVSRWLYFEVKSLSYADARGFVLGELYDENGLPVATVTQEGLIRKFE